MGRLHSRDTWLLEMPVMPILDFPGAAVDELGKDTTRRCSPSIASSNDPLGPAVTLSRSICVPRKNS